MRLRAMSFRPSNKLKPPLTPMRIRHSVRGALVWL